MSTQKECAHAAGKHEAPHVLQGTEVDCVLTYLKLKGVASYCPAKFNSEDIKYFDVCT